jgi:hypothetical protein
MDESTKVLAEVRDLLKRAEDRAAEDRRVARAASMHPDRLRGFCTLVALLCILLGIATGYVALQALDVSGYLSLAFAGGAALLLVGAAVSAWCGRNCAR